MNMMKAILMIALTLAVTIAVTTYTTTRPEQIQGPKQSHYGNESQKPWVGPNKLTHDTPKKRVSRFLAEDKAKNPRAADHCHKDGEVCAATNTTCCNNKCIDLHVDHQNCGACKKKCKYTESCCRGQCANLSFDKRHCGECSNKCLTGQFCIYGMCDYA